jgi:hypothetical protein
MTWQFAAVFLVMAVAILLWGALVHRMTVNATRIYRFTGYIGVPIHELAHALVCLVFGMRITKISFFRHNSETGAMGQVSFKYSPYSMGHALGLALHGVAPMLAGAAVVYLVLGIQGDVPSGAGQNLLQWISGAVTWTVGAARTIATDGLLGALLFLFLLSVSMHCIPSRADILTGLRGLAVLTALGAAVAVAFDLFWMVEYDLGDRFGFLVAKVLVGFERAIQIALFAVVGQVVMAVIGGVLLVLVPSMILYAVAFIRGARGKI